MTEAQAAVSQGKSSLCLYFKRCLSKDTINVTNAPGIVASIADAFKRVSCRDFME